MTEGNDQGSKSTIEGLQQSIKLGRERLAQARELKLTQSEIRQINQEEMRLRTDILRVKSEDLDLSKAERDQARLKLAEREKELENLREQTAEIERQKGLQDDILDSIGSFGGKFQKSFIDKLIESNISLDQVKGKLKETFTLANTANMLGSMAFSTVTQAMMATVMMASKAQSELAKATGTGFELAGAVGDAANGAKQFGVGYEEAARAIGTLHGTVSAFSGLNRDVQAEMGQTAAMLESVGVSAQESGAQMEFGMRIMGQSGEEAAASAKDMAKFAKGIGVAPAQMAKDFNAAAPQIASYGKNAEKVFKGLARQSKKLGISMNELLSITSQFDTFDGAFDAAGKLNSLLGGQFLDSMELMTAETEEQRVQLLQNALAMSGKSFDAMSRHEKMAVANSIGITDMSVATKLLSKENQKLAAEQKEKAVSDEEFAKSMEAGVDVSKKLMLALQGIAVAVMPLVEMLSWAASWIVWFSDTWAGKAVLWTLATAFVVYQGVRLFRYFANAISEFGEDAADSADDVSEGIGDAIENLSETIKNSAGNIKDSMVSIAQGIGESIKALLQGIGEGLGAMLQGMARGLEALAAPKVIIGGLVLMGIVFAVAALVYAFSQLFGVFAASIDIMPTLFLYFIAFSVILNVVGLSFAVAAIGIQMFTVGLATMLLVGIPAMAGIIIPLLMLTLVVAALATAFVLMAFGMLTIAYASLQLVQNFGALAEKIASMSGDLLKISASFGMLAIGMSSLIFVLAPFGTALMYVAIPLMFISGSIVLVANAITKMVTAFSNLPAEQVAQSFGAIASQVSAMKGDLLILAGAFVGLGLGLFFFSLFLPKLALGLALVSLPLMFVSASIVLISLAIEKMATAFAQLPAEQVAANLGLIAAQISAMKGDLIVVVGLFASLVAGFIMFGLFATQFAAGLALVAIPLAFIASSIVRVADAIAGMATAIAQMPVENSLTTFVETVNTLDDDSIDNLDEMMDQAERYVVIQASMNAMQIANSIADSIGDLFGIDRGSSSKDRKKPQREIVLKLNDREFARAVVESLDDKTKISLA